MRKIFAALLMCVVSFAAIAGGSSPGLYYGQVPTAAQWNSYFAAKLDYTPGSANTIPYWNGSGSLLNAPVSGDCTAVANVFTCSVTSSVNLAGGALGAIPYQSGASTTAFLLGNTTTTPQFLTSTGTGAAAQAPTLTSSTGSGSVVLATSPTLMTPNLGTPSALVGTNITGTATGLSIGGTAASVAGGTQWGVLYQSASGVTASTAAGASGEVLTGNGAAAPTFQSIGNPFAGAIHAATSKTTPVGADEVGIWDSVSGLLNKVTFTNLLNYFAPKAGSSTQTFDVAAATTGTHAVNRDTGDARYALRTNSIAQIVTTHVGSVATGTTLIPNDNTIPQNTEGDQYMSLSITPTNASSTLEVEVTFFGASSVANNLAVALFQDTSANALAVGNVTVGINVIGEVHISHLMTAGTTAATTFKVRAGGNNAGTTTFNGAASTALYGGTLESRITIKEYLP